MGQNGYVYFFTERRPEPLEPTLRAVCELIAAPALRVVWSRQVLEASVQTLPDGLSLVEAEEMTKLSKLIGENVSVEKAAQLASRYPLVAICPLELERAQPFTTLMPERIPPEIRGNVFLSGAEVHVGPEHLYQSCQMMDDRVSHYYGQSQFAVVVTAYSTPADWKSFERLLFEMPEFMAFKADLAAILGPVKHCIVWYC
ncbi:MAG: hypothetical protein IPM33_03975 [Phycisphaerales bacterium]|nr:hypothetical protein [Phycisphaerales bacterium]